MKPQQEHRPRKKGPVRPVSLRRSKYQIFPPHPPNRRAALAALIKHHGVESPTVWGDKGNLLDG